MGIHPDFPILFPRVLFLRPLVEPLSGFGNFHTQKDGVMICCPFLRFILTWKIPKAPPKVYFNHFLVFSVDPLPQNFRHNWKKMTNIFPENVNFPIFFLVIFVPTAFQGMVTDWLWGPHNQSVIFQIKMSNAQALGCLCTNLDCPGPQASALAFLTFFFENCTSAQCPCHFQS